MVIRILALLAICCSTSSAQEIPLSEIWALNMPGTKDVYGLGFAESDKRRYAGWGPTEFREMRERSINQMMLALSDKLPSEKAARGFIVPWQSNSQVLKRIGELIRTAKKNEIFDIDVKEYPKGSDVTLIYFSYPSSYYNHIKEVERDGHKITVGYQLVPHYSGDSTVNFALIPLKDLPAGEIQVKFRQLPMDKKFYEAGFIQVNRSQQMRLVCNDFSFRIWEPVKPDRTEASKDAEDISLGSIWGFKMPGTKDIREIDTPHPSDRDTIARKISRSLYSGKVGQKAGPILTVKGSGKEALLSVERIISKRMQAPSVFEQSDDINLYIYARSAGAGARLDRIVRDGRQIRIEYHLGSRDDVGTALRFVLVPLGKLEKGRYSVEMIMKPRDPDSENRYPANKYRVISPDHLKAYLSQNTSFSVQ